MNLNQSRYYGRGTYANRPAAGIAGRVYQCTDSPIQYIDNGSSWIGQGVSPYTSPPAAAGFTVYSAGGRTTTIADSLGGLKMSYTDGTTAYDERVAIKTVAAAPYTWTAFIRPSTFADTQLFGLALRQSSNGSIETFDYASATTFAGSPGFQFHNATANNTSTSPTYTQNATGAIGVAIPHDFSGGIWMQIQDDNTNRLYRYSTDGINFRTLRSVVRTSFITPDQYGIHIFNSSSTNTAQSIWLPSLG